MHILSESLFADRLFFISLLDIKKLRYFILLEIVSIINKRGNYKTTGDIIMVCNATISEMPAEKLWREIAEQQGWTANIYTTDVCSGWVAINPDGEIEEFTFGKYFDSEDAVYSAVFLHRVLGKGADDSGKYDEAGLEKAIIKLCFDLGKTHGWDKNECALRWAVFLHRLW